MERMETAAKDYCAARDARIEAATKPWDRVCEDCAHAVPFSSCNRHKNILSGHYISFSDARGLNPYEEYPPYLEGFDDCGIEGKFWAPRVGGTFTSEDRRSGEKRRCSERLTGSENRLFDRRKGGAE